MRPSSASRTTLAVWNSSSPFVTMPNRTPGSASRQRVERGQHVVVQGPRVAVVPEVLGEPLAGRRIVELVAELAGERRRPCPALALERERAVEVGAVVLLLEVVPQAGRRRLVAVVCAHPHVLHDPGGDRLAVGHERVVEVEQHDRRRGRRPSSGLQDAGPALGGDGVGRAAAHGVPRGQGAAASRRNGRVVGPGPPEAGGPRHLRRGDVALDRAPVQRREVADAAGQRPLGRRRPRPRS